MTEVPDLVSKKPAPDADDLMADLKGLFLPLVEQHARMVATAVSRLYGLLRHCD